MADASVASTIGAHDERWNDVVIRYYEDCEPDYRRMWRSGEALSMHMGYWTDETLTHQDALIEMNRVMAERGGLRPGMRVLDAGCGLGGSTIWLAQHDDVHVTGINLSVRAVMQAQQNAHRRGVMARTTFRCRDFLDTGFADGEFDLVWAQESVCHAQEKEAFFHEAHRVLRPDGCLVMEEGLRFARPYAPADERLLHHWLSGWAVPDLATGDEYVAWSRRAGFEEVDLEDITAHSIRSLRRLYVLATLFYPYGWFRHPVRRVRAMRSGATGGIADDSPLDVDVRFRNCRGARYQWYALQRRLWFLGILTARKRS